MRPDDDREAQPSEPDGAEAWLPIPPQTLAAVSAAFAALLLALSILHIHGFSLPCWHEVIDRSPEPEVLLGRGRLTRSDDWAVGLPAILSQSVHRPRFPVWNRLIGEGETKLEYRGRLDVRHRMASRMRGLFNEIAEDQAHSLVHRVKVKAEQRRLAQERLLK